MSSFKKQFQRLCLIDTCIKTYSHPTKEMITQFVEEGMYEKLCYSTIEKDMFFMRYEFDAPLKYKKIGPGGYGGYYYSDSSYDFSKSFLEYWSTWLFFPKEIREFLFKN